MIGFTNVDPAPDTPAACAADTVRSATDAVAKRLARKDFMRRSSKGFFRRFDDSTILEMMHDRNVTGRRDWRLRVHCGSGDCFTRTPQFVFILKQAGWI